MNSKNPSLIILAAGVGSRLGNSYPKCFSVLPNGETILARQIRLARENGLQTIIGVCGFKKDIIMENHPDILYCYNQRFHLTNTFKSLLQALVRIQGDVIWINGDVIFNGELLKNIIDTDGNIVVVDHKECYREEVKYRTNSDGYICEISKQVSQAEGEAVGLNRVSGSSLHDFVHCLEECADNDYFERGIELSIKKGLVWKPMTVGDLPVLEIDFEEDWQKAKQLFFDEN